MSRGIVALGDSITRGHGGSPALGVHFQSWVLWLADAMERPLTNLAIDGVTATDVLAEQVPKLEGPYELGFLLIGANDTRGMAWDPARYQRELGAIVAALREAAARVVVLTLPEDLGRPTAAPKPAAANAILRALGGVEIVELADLGGRTHLLPDAVHPTSAGMVEIARRVALGIGAPAPRVDVPPRDLRYDAWWLRLWLRDVRRRRSERRGSLNP
ncbi:MAG: GDSL-type esterase/lipase family protein [Solirubrobacteraceae bacterium]